MNLGPNHKDGCPGSDYRYSGRGYNRVRVCACGAEDHAPEEPARPWWRQWQPCVLGDFTSSSYIAAQQDAQRWREINEEHEQWEADLKKNEVRR